MTDCAHEYDIGSRHVVFTGLIRCRLCGKFVDEHDLRKGNFVDDSTEFVRRPKRKTKRHRKKQNKLW